MCAAATRLNPRLMTRRAWLGAAAAALAAGAAPGRLSAQVAESAASEAETRHQASVEARARAVGLSALQTTRSPGYLAIGDAPAVFRQNALAACEALALDFLEYYQGQGFPAQKPTERMVLVALADRQSFLRYLALEVSEQVVGVYDRGLNQLVIYDSRVPTSRKAVARPRYVNQVSLAHEATHQLCYNTGLLNRQGDAPGSIVEGLALFGEVRRTVGRSSPGLLNQDRLHDLAHMQRRGNAWINVSRLLTEDHNTSQHRGLTDEQRTLYYAESWLLTYFLLKEPGRRQGFRSYLQAIHDRTSAEHRLDDARAHLGDLDQLDLDLKRYAIRLLKGG